MPTDQHKASSRLRAPAAFTLLAGGGRNAARPIASRASVNPGDLVTVRAGAERGAVGVVVGVLGQLAQVTTPSGQRITATLESIQVIRRGMVPESGPGL